MPTIQCSITQAQYDSFSMKAKSLGYKGIAPFLVSLAEGEPGHYVPYRPKVSKIDLREKILQFIQRSEVGCSKRNIHQYVGGNAASAAEINRILEILVDEGEIWTRQERRTRKTSTIYYATPSH